MSESAGASTALLRITPAGSDRDTREGSYPTGPDSYPTTDKEGGEAQFKRTSIWDIRGQFLLPQEEHITPSAKVVWGAELRLRVRDTQECFSPQG